MFKKRLLTSIFLLIALFILWSIFFIDSPSNTQISVKIDTDKIRKLQINNLILSAEFYPYLNSLNNLKIVSFSKEHYPLFGLGEADSDMVEIEFSDNTSLILYTGNIIDRNEGVYIRFEQDEAVYQCDDQLLSIIREKPDALREYPLFNNMELISVIALNIQTDEFNIFATATNQQLWIDQISGRELNSFKIQNFINRLLNLRVVRRDQESDLNDFPLLIKLESATGEVETLLIAEEENFYIIKDDADKIYTVEKDKLDFTGITLEDLQ